MSTASEIADLILRKGELQGQGSQNQGAIWGGTLRDLGQTVAAIPTYLANQQARQQENQLRNEEMQLRSQEMQLRGVDLQKAQQAQADQQALDQAMQAGIVKRPDGTFGSDRTAITSSLVAQGKGHLLPTLQQHWDASDKTMAEALDAQQKYLKAQTEDVAGLATSHIGLLDAGEDPGDVAGHMLTEVNARWANHQMDDATHQDLVAQLNARKDSPQALRTFFKSWQDRSKEQSEALASRTSAAKSAAEIPEIGVRTDLTKAQIPGAVAESTLKEKVAAGTSDTGITAEQQARLDVEKASAAALEKYRAGELSNTTALRQIERARLDLDKQRVNLSGGGTNDPDTVAGYVRLVKNGDVPLQNVPEKGNLRNTVVKALESTGANIDKLTTQGKQMKETAKTLLPMIDKVQSLAEQLDQRGLMGTLGGRARNMASVESAAASMQGLSPADRKLIGEFASAGGLLLTGIARAHGGARAGGSPQMVEHLGKLMAAGNKDLPTFIGNLNGERDFMNAYAGMGEEAGSAAPTPNATAAPKYKVGDKVTYQGQQKTVIKVYPDGSVDMK